MAVQSIPLQWCPLNHFKFENAIQYWLISFNQRYLVFQNNSHLPDCLGSVFFSCGSTCFNLLWSNVFTSALVSAASSLISKTTSLLLSISCERYDHVTHVWSLATVVVFCLSEVFPLTVGSAQFQGRGVVYAWGTGGHSLYALVQANWLGEGKEGLVRNSSTLCNHTFLGGQMRLICSFNMFQFFCRVKTFNFL